MPLQVHPKGQLALLRAQNAALQEQARLPKEELLAAESDAPAAADVVDLRQKLAQAQAQARAATAQAANLQRLFRRRSCLQPRAPLLRLQMSWIYGRSWRRRRPRRGLPRLKPPTCSGSWTSNGRQWWACGGWWKRRRLPPPGTALPPGTAPLKRLRGSVRRRMPGTHAPSWPLPGQRCGRSSWLQDTLHSNARCASVIVLGQPMYLLVHFAPPQPVLTVFEQQLCWQLRSGKLHQNALCVVRSSRPAASV